MSCTSQDPYTIIFVPTGLDPVQYATEIAVAPTETLRSLKTKMADKLNVRGAFRLVRVDCEPDHFNARVARARAESGLDLWKKLNDLYPSAPSMRQIHFLLDSARKFSMPGSNVTNAGDLQPCLQRPVCPLRPAAS